MTIYKKNINAQKTARACCIMPHRLYILGILLGTVLFFRPLQAHAQDSIPQLPQGTLNSTIQHLKQSLDQAIADADFDHVTTLLQTSKDQHYPAGQVVALCEMAGIYDGQQPDESAKSLQEAQQLAAQLRDFMEVSWAMVEVGKMQQYNSSKSVDLRRGWGAVLRSLGLAMRNSKVNTHPRSPGKPNSGLAGADTDDAYLSGLKQAAMITKAVRKGLAGGKQSTDWDFSDHWLDTLIGKGNPSQKTARRLIAQKNSRDSIKALSNAFSKKG